MEGAAPLPLLQPAPLVAPAATSPASNPQPVAVGTLAPPGAASVPSNPTGSWGGSVSGPGSSTATVGAVGTLASPVPQPLQLPAYVPRPVPGPTLPEFEPQPQTEPEVAPGVVPTTTPTTTPTTDPKPAPLQPGVVPAPGPASTPTTLPGEVPAPAPLPVPVTSPETDFPVPGGVPVTGVSIRPDLKAIAREVGRIEGKTAQLLNGQGKPPGGGNGEGGEICRFQPDPIWQQILSTLLESDGAGSYQLQGPCEKDEAGNLKPPDVASWGLSIGIKGTIVKRLDALAELLQYHKDQKQPICTPGRAVGQPVTVTFEEVQEEPDA